MSIKEIVLASGAKIQVHFAGMEKAFDLKDAIQEELFKININFDKDVDFEKMDVMAFKNLFCKVDSSKEVRKYIFSCMESCLYNGLKVNKDTFSSYETLGDYYEVALAVVSHNLTPFFKNLGQKLQTVLKMIQSSQN